MRLDDYDNSLPTTIETIEITVRNETSGDLETIMLTETGLDTGIFVNTNGLPSDVSSGLLEQDGILFVSPGDQLSVTYNDPYFGDSSTAHAVVLIPSLNKVLYLNAGNELDRLDPAVDGGSGSVQTTALNGPSGGTVTFGSTTSQQYDSFSSASFSHDSGTDPNRLLLVSVAYQDDNSGTPTASVDTMTYAGVAMSRISRVATAFEAGVELWMSTTEPPTGSNTLVVTMNTSAGLEDGIVSATTFSGVDLSDPLSQTNSVNSVGFPGGVSLFF